MCGPVLTDARGREVEPSDWVVWFYGDKTLMAEVQIVDTFDRTIQAGHMELDPKSCFVAPNRASILFGGDTEH